jgi:hypothetical protein
MLSRLHLGLKRMLVYVNRCQYAMAKNLVLLVSEEPCVANSTFLRPFFKAKAVLLRVVKYVL